MLSLLPSTHMHTLTHLQLFNLLSNGDKSNVQFPSKVIRQSSIIVVHTEKGSTHLQRGDEDGRGKEREGKMV